MPSDTTTIALAGIIATAVVGIAGPAIAAVVGHYQRRDERRTAREDELRTVAELAAVRLTESILRMDTARDAMIDTSPNPHIEPLDEDIKQLYLNEDRIGIRLGTDAPEYVLYHQAVAAWQRAYHDLGAMSSGDGRDPSEISAARNEAYDAGERFKDVVAARLSPDASRRTRRRVRS